MLLSMGFPKYVCEVCHSEYDTAEKAIRCECYHKGIPGFFIESAGYDKNGKYPNYLNVRFEDGRSYHYAVVEGRDYCYTV